MQTGLLSRALVWAAGMKAAVVHAATIGVDVVSSRTPARLSGSATSDRYSDRFEDSEPTAPAPPKGKEVPPGAKNVDWTKAEFRAGELEKHFKKHGRDWSPPLASKEIYLQKARDLLSAPAGGDILEHFNSKGDVLRYNVRTNEFTVGSEWGKIRTCFPPRDGIEYWKRQLEGAGPPPGPPIGVDNVDWAKAEFRKGALDEQFKKNGRDWDPPFATMDDYLARARALLGAPAGGEILRHVNKDGDLLRYDPRTNELTVGSGWGVIRTLIRPRDGMAYWQKQLEL